MNHQKATIALRRAIAPPLACVVLVFVDADRIERLTARTPDGIAALCAGIDRVRPASPAR